MVSVYDFGKGRFVLNTLRIRENLASHPAAERLLRNMLRYASKGSDRPVAKLPPNFDQELKSRGL